MNSPSTSAMKDVIVVGGGPAGSTAARRLALSGRKVLLIEKARFPRYKSCGGAITAQVRSLLDFDISPVVERTVRKMDFSYRGKAQMPARSVSDLTIFMVMRSTFDNLLLTKAKEAGVEVLEGERLVDLVLEPQGVTVQTRSGAVFSGKVCIGADGAASRVASLSGLRPKHPPGMGLSAEVRMPGERRIDPLDETIVLDFGEMASGYRWIFPKAEQFSIGVCTTGTDRNNLKDSLNRYMATSRIIRGCELVALKGHPLPFYRSGQKLQAGRVLLVGDAAGLVDPLTGEGILSAIQSALIAARCVEEFFLGRASLEVYPDKIAADIMHDFHYAALFTELFFSRPWVGYAVGVANRAINNVMIDVLMGRGTYEDSYQALRATLVGKLRRWILATSMGEKGLSVPVRVS